ncbi:MAG: discoidin domain-containing protein [Phycisphaerales bacterium]|nr:MAG: discoidin domain-containing protein [Phycisphaerales bacterium]
MMLPSASAQVLFFADFEDGVGVNDPAQWVPDNAGQAWGVAAFPGSGQGLSQLNEGCGNSGNTPLPGVTNFTDGIIQLDMSWNDDDSWGVIFRKTADDAGYIVFFGYIETPYVIIGDLANGCAPDGTCLDSTTCEGGGGEIIQVDHGLGAGLTQDLSVSYTGRVEVQGDTIKVWYLPTADIADPLGDFGPPLVEIQDSAHGGPGSVGIWHESQGGSMIDNVMIFGVSPGLASDPHPADGATDVIRDSILSWQPGEFAATHDVYLGTAFDDVNDASRANPGDVLASQGQTGTSYDAGRLELGQTYYWRVDEVNAAPDNTIFKGNVWSFTVEPLAYPVTGIAVQTNAISDEGSGPEKTIDGSGLNSLDQHSTEATDMWSGAASGADPVYLEYEFDRVYKLHELLVWNYNVQFELLLGYGVKDVTVEYSEDGENWTTLGDVEFAQATATSDYTANTTVDFGGVPVRFVRLTINAGHGIFPRFGLSEVRFTYIPAHAREPQPDDGATGVDVGTALAWRAGREADRHEVYLGTDPNDLALIETTEAPSAVAPGLEFGSDYFWKVDEVNEAEAISVWEGSLWSFATQDFALIDGFESYDDEENRIYDTWLDGWVNETGSTVGYLEAPFAETTIVNSGRQSMPLQYDNSAAPFYSEAEYDLGGMNLAGNGADRLQLFVSGLAPGFYEAGDDVILMNAIGTDIWNTGDQFRFAYKSLTGNGSLVARVDDLDVTPDVWVKAGVMIRQDTGTGSQHSFMPITGSGGNGASWQGRVDEGLASENQDNSGDPVAAPYWVRIDRSGNSFTGFISPDGETWTQIGDPRDVVMNDPVLIGLALTSHNANQATSAQFSNVTFTGNVTGAWEVAEIGATQPEGNDPEPVYLAIEDTSGNVAVVTCPADPPASAWSAWYEWVIPYSELGGVNLNSAATMYIGVGDRDNPTSGGEGLIVVDDIGYGRPYGAQ